GVRNAGPRATIMGIAPRAYLGSYKVFPDGQDGAPNSAILKAIDDAVADGMDVINLSLGAFPAERLDSDPLVTAVENASRAGVIVVIAAGNDGPGLNTIGSPGTAPSAISVGSSANDRVFASSAWLEGLSPFLALPGDGPRSVNLIRGQLSDVSALDPTGLACGTLPEGSLSGKIVLILRGTCFFEEKLNNVSRAGAIGAVIYTDAERETVTMSTNGVSLPAVMITYADGLKARERLQSGAAEVVVDFSQNAVPSDATHLPDFTSKGPSVDNRLKPELLAIGTSVYTASPSSSYALMQGTSFSAPMVAGAAALLKAYRPGLSVEQYKSLLMNSTAQFTAGLQETGAGLLDIGASVRSTVTAIPSALEFGVGGSTVDVSRSFVLRNLGGTSETYSISAAPLSDGSVPKITPDVVQLGPGSSADIVVRLNEANLPARSHEGFLTIRGAQAGNTTRLPYWYAATDGKAKSINIIEAPEEGRRASTQNFYVRVLDSAGVPLPNEPKVTVISGLGASVTSVESVEFRYPGFYQVRVRLSSEPGENAFEIDGGGTTTRVTISGS
ncbi:MAG TPA: S8 family serine peptidase, partial [Bryobacteraceae bacterium]|nr:S8 family serine peptidase [Bryobacteraceae bacterium]